MGNTVNILGFVDVQSLAQLLSLAAAVREKPLTICKHLCANKIDNGVIA
jgi:hypothetical protein